MSDRKQTPDILAEILGGSASVAPATPPPPAAAPAQPRPKKATQPRPAAASKPRPAISEQWEYQLVTFQEYHGWRPRFIDGKPVKDWMVGPQVHDFLKHMGEQRWELAAASSGHPLYGNADRLHLYFKRKVS